LSHGVCVRGWGGGVVWYGVAWSLGVTMGNVGLEIKVGVERSLSYIV
jgi:hypothetical protein